MSKEIVMISDQSRARFFMRPDDEGRFSEISDFINTQENLREDQMGHGGPGAPATPMHIFSRAMSSEEKAYRHGWDRFAQTLIDTLEGYVENQPDSHVVIVAPPRFLGVIRKKMTPSVKRHLVKEINHNITMIKTNVIEKMLPDYIRRSEFD